MSIFSRHNKGTAPRRHISHESVTREEQYAYRRNRTFTGTASPLVASVNELRSELSSPRVQTHLLRRRRHHVSWMILGSLLAAVAVFYLMQHVIIAPDVQIMRQDTYVRHSGSESVPYERAIEEYLATYPLERFSFSLNNKNLITSIQEAHPEVERLIIDHQQLGSPTRFVMTPRLPLAAWTIDGKKQYVDKNGIAYGANFYEEPVVGIVDASELPHGGKTVASVKFLEFVGKVLGYSKQFDLTATKITLPYHTTRQVEVRYETLSYPIKLSIDRPAGEQIEDISRIARYATARGINIEYLDVRTPGRCYYKTK